MPPRVHKKRRLYTVLTILAAAGVIFLGFQFLSAEVLSLQSQLDAAKSINEVEEMKHKVDNTKNQAAIVMQQVRAKIDAVKEEMRKSLESSDECLPGENCPLKVESNDQIGNIQNKYKDMVKRNDKYKKIEKNDDKDKHGKEIKKKDDKDKEIVMKHDKNKLDNDINKKDDNDKEFGMKADKDKLYKDIMKKDDKDKEIVMKDDKDKHDKDIGNIDDEYRGRPGVVPDLQARLQQQKQIEHKKTLHPAAGANAGKSVHSKADKNNTSHHMILNTGEVPRGVPVWLAKQYLPDSGSFTCLQSKEKISFSRVNDDYCDCTDSTDEPGTSACPQSRFYCQFQLDEQKEKWLPSSQVNDGICDCCDGSDEWKKLELSDHVKLQDGKKYGQIYQAPCMDRCDEMKVEKKRLEEIRQQGLILRQKYVDTAKKTNYDTELYGSDGAWYPLSNECFEMQADKYTYKLCPFRDARQISHPGPSRVIGRQAAWLSQGSEKGYKLLMDNGDNTQCPGRSPRKAQVNFSCDLEDKLLSVHEEESCSYNINFATPLACL